MHRLSLALVCSSLALSLTLADEVLKSPTPAPPPAAKAPELKPLDEVWEAAYVQNNAGVDVKIGHVHLTSIPVAVLLHFVKPAQQL